MKYDLGLLLWDENYSTIRHYATTNKLILTDMPILQMEDEFDEDMSVLEVVIDILIRNNITLKLVRHLKSSETLIIYFEVRTPCETFRSTKIKYDRFIGLLL